MYHTGFYLGKFIYLMDAWDDLKKDERTGSYNILLLKQRTQEKAGTFDKKAFAAYVEQLLVGMMAACSAAFERLPLVQDVAICENILYDGVWKRFDKMKEEAAKAAKETV